MKEDQGLSLGQRQLVSFARAPFSKPKNINT